MDFKQRFKGRVSTMNKEGVLGIVKMQGQPVEKQQYASPTFEQRGQFFKSDLEQQPERMLPAKERYPPVSGDRNPYHYPNQTKEADTVYTHIVSNRNSRAQPVKAQSQAFRQNAQMVLRSHQSPEPQMQEPLRQRQVYAANNFNSNFNGLDMNEYELIAVPKRYINQNEMLFSQQSLAHSQIINTKANSNTSQLFRATANEPSDNYHLSPLIKTYSYDPKFMQRNTDGYTQKHGARPVGNQKSSKFLMQAGMGSLNKKSDQSARHIKLN